MSDDEMLYIRVLGLLVLVLVSYLAGYGFASIIIQLGWLPW